MGESPTLKRAKPNSAELNAAVAYISAHPNGQSYLLLFLVKWHSPTQYADIPAATRAAVLCGAIGNLQALNEFDAMFWNLDREERAEPARMLLETGDAAVPHLLPLLADRSRVAIYGSSEAAAAAHVKYRRADVAYRLLAKIVGVHPQAHDDPSERDKFIRDLEAEVKQAPAKKGRASRQRGR